jgi:membrane-associated protein
MAYETLLNAIHELGYIALFFALCLGLVGLPIPNEVVVMTGGALAASGILAPVPSFIMTFLGICSGLSVGYFIGRFAGNRILVRFNSRRSIQRFLNTSENLSKKYGSYAVGISTFIPLLRNVTPYVVGMNRMPYPRFASFAYVSAFLMTSVYFLIGTFVGEHVRYLGTIINRYGVGLVAVLAALSVIYGIVKWMQKRKKKPLIPVNDPEPPIEY